MELIDTIISYINPNLNVFPILTVISILLLCLLYSFYRVMSRIKDISDLPKNIRNKKIKGLVTKVGDGDGFLFFHIPFLRSSIYEKNDPVIKIRLAGVDAPEIQHFKKPAQRFAKEAKEHLTKMLKNKIVKLTIYRVDLYNRLVCKVNFKGDKGKWQNASVEMVKYGMAHLYCGEGAEYGDFYDELYKEEKKARKKKIGLWIDDEIITPMEYKKQYQAV